MKRFFSSVFLLMVVVAMARGFPVQTNEWTVDPSEPNSITHRVGQGEQHVMEFTFNPSNNLAGMSAVYFYRHSAMTNWWVITGSVDEATVTIPWSNANDAGYSKYDGWVRVLSGSIPAYRIKLGLNMYATPGFTPDLATNVPSGGTNAVIYANDPVYLAAVTNATIAESTSNAVSVNGRTIAITVNTNYAAADTDTVTIVEAGTGVSIVTNGITNTITATAASATVVEPGTYTTVTTNGVSNAVDVAAAYGINWDTAYSWGDHGTSGYLTAPPGTNTTTVMFNYDGNYSSFFGASVTNVGMAPQGTLELYPTGALTLYDVTGNPIDIGGDYGIDVAFLSNNTPVEVKTTATAGNDIVSWTVLTNQIAVLSPVTNKTIAIAASDETTDLTTGTAKATFRMPYAMTVDEVRISVTTAPVGSVLTVDINESGSTILSTKPTIDAGEKTSTTAATPPVISDANLADDAEITIDIDAIGASTAGAGLKVYLIDNP